MPEQPSYLHLNAFMVREEYTDKAYSDLLSLEANTRTYALSAATGIDGVLFVKQTQEKKPTWAPFAEQLVAGTIEELTNKSSSAVLLLKSEGEIFAFTFGYGRHLIDHRYFVSDFGIKTALNTLQHDSLRSVDLYTVQDQALQRKAQAVRASEMGVFGIDISRDVLRAVTGEARADIGFQHISGADAVYSFGITALASDLPAIASSLSTYYVLEHYKQDFLWVDNIRRVKDKPKIEELDLTLLEAIQQRNHEAVSVTIPEVVAWDSIYGFSFTRSKTKIRPTLTSSSYFEKIKPAEISIDSVKTDRLFVHDTEGNVSHHSIYKCLYFEKIEGDMTYVFFSGEWYEINNAFKTRIDTVLQEIPLSELVFPSVQVWQEDGKDKIESEGDYNVRTAAAHGYYLLDKKLVKSNRTTTPIELCDLLTGNRQFIHVKHRKGGSAGLSHLFAQGSVAAEVLLGDKEFRIEARKVLRRVHRQSVALVPADAFRSADSEIVYLILGEASDTLKGNLPFFSKVNLSKAYESLSQRGYKVSIAGAPTVARLAQP